MTVLGAAKVFNTLRRWKQIEIAITEAFNEAKDNVTWRGESVRKDGKKYPHEVPQVSFTWSVWHFCANETY